jgi:hypothetical protein
LYNPIAIFTLPRLKRFKELAISYPCEFNSLEEWEAVIDKMIFSLEQLANDEWDVDTEGLELFGRYLPHLWW